MNRFKRHLSKAMPVFVALGIANAALWAIEGISGSYNAYLSAFFIVLNLVGAWAVWLTWQKKRQEQKGDSSSADSDAQ